MTCTIRALTLQDELVVWEMLMYAAHESTLTKVKEQAELARYAQNWGRTGDMGYAAYMDELAIGAAWLRLWTGEERGYGYIDASIPELAIAVLPDYRGHGVGTRLLKQILETAKDLFPAISLSVRSESPAVRLYQRLGFTKVEGTELVNRTNSTSFNMVYKF